LDTDVALAACAEEYGYVRPVYEEVADEAEANARSGLAVVGLRHPILERVHSETPYISHSIALGSLASAASAAASADQGILLYGVNAAGKSSLSKAIGLAVLMAQIGMPVPATEMRIAPYKSLFTRILGNDNLWAGMSSFVVEMTEFRSILKAAGPTTLVLGDELCAGTETVSAIAIVGAGIQTLVGKGAQFVFATHLHELMTMPELAAPLATGAVRAYHLSVVPDMRGRLIYDRKLKEGSGSPIYGLEVCRGLDMDAGFLEAAMGIRRRLEGARGFAATSRYNAAIPVQACSVCGKTQGTLETHHIRPQAAADAKGRVEPGRHKNEAGNLVVLCESCHDAHHRGDLEIRGWVATTEGRVLDLSVQS
jgi:DNA mismatch repair protein MutS